MLSFVNHNLDQQAQAVVDGCGAVAVVNVAAALRLQQEKFSKQPSGSRPAGRMCTGRCDGSLMLVHEDPSYSESTSERPIRPSISTWQGLPAPVWATLILSKTLSS